MTKLSTASRQPARQYGSCCGVCWPGSLLDSRSMLQQPVEAMQTQAVVCDGLHLLLSSSATLQKPHASVSVVLDSALCTRNSCSLVSSAFCTSPAALDILTSAAAPDFDRSCCDGKLSTRCCVASCMAAGSDCSSIVTASVIQRLQLRRVISLNALIADHKRA